jgi:hypothetical protein
MQDYLAYGFIASVGSITKRASLYSILLAVIISSLANCRVTKTRGTHNQRLRKTKPRQNRCPQK